MLKVAHFRFQAGKRNKGRPIGNGRGHKFFFCGIPKFVLYSTEIRKQGEKPRILAEFAGVRRARSAAPECLATNGRGCHGDLGPELGYIFGLNHIEPRAALSVFLQNKVEKKPHLFFYIYKVWGQGGT